MFSSSPTPQRQPVVSNRPSLQEALAQVRAASQATTIAPAYDPAKNGVVNQQTNVSQTQTGSNTPHAMPYGGFLGLSGLRGGGLRGGGSRGYTGGSNGQQYYTPGYTSDQWEQIYGSAPTTQNWR